MSADNLLPVVTQPVPVFDGDLNVWAENITGYLNDPLNSGGASSPLQFPVKDSSGRVIIDRTGFYLFDSFGTLFVSPNIVEIDTTHLVDAAITTSKIANTAVDNAKLANLAVDAAKLADSAVTATKIASLAVGTAAIANAAVGTAQIANLAVTSALIGDAAIVTAKIANLAVNSGQIANAAIDSAKIANAAVVNAHIVNGAIDNLKIVNTLNSSDFAFTPGVTATGWSIAGTQSGAGLITVNSIKIVDDSGNVILESGANPTGALVDSTAAAQTSANTATTNAATAQTSADTAQTTADGAVIDASSAQTSANTAQAAADNAQTDATTALANAASAQGTPVFYQTATPATTGPEGSVWVHSTTKVMKMLRGGVWINIGFSEPITSANITTFISGAAIGNAQIGNAAIGTANIANAAIGTAQIANLAVTNALLADASITTAKIGTAAITSATIADTIQSANFAYTAGVSASGWRISGMQAGGLFEGSQMKLYDSSGNTILDTSNKTGVLVDDTTAAALTAAWVSVTGKPLDADILNSVQSWADLQDIPQQQILDNFLDTSVWVVGSQGTQGSFNMNGNTAENTIIFDVGPYGNAEALWKCQSDTGDGLGADGGWNKYFTTAEGYLPEVTCRYTVWAKQTETSGSIYLGCNACFSTGGVVNTNPYFFSGDLPQNNKWYLLVGILHGKDYTGLSSGISGVYDPVTGVRVLAGTDYVIDPAQTQQRHRAYLYYSSTTTNIVTFARPRIDILNGNESSLLSLMFLDSALNNNISIDAAGTLTGAGGGQVTISGLGFTGALNATNNTGALADLDTVNYNTQVLNLPTLGAIAALSTLDAGVYISNSTIVASKMAANSIVAASIAAGAVVAGKIAANAVTATEIAANAVTASKINVTDLTAISTQILQSLSVGSLSKLLLDGLNNRLDVIDGGITRARLGNLGTDYGLELKDSSGAVFLKADGQGIFSATSTVDGLNMARGLTAGQGRDGDAVTFSSTWNSVPIVKFSAGGLTNSATLTGDQFQDIKAQNVTTTGFTLYAKITELASGLVTHTDIGAVSTGTHDWEIEKSSATEAYDNTYTFSWDVLISNTFDFELNKYLGGSITVTIYTRSTSGGAWVSRGSVTTNAPFFPSSSTSLITNVTLATVVSGILNHSGTEFAVSMTLGNTGSAIQVFNSVVYTTSTAPQTVTATPTGAPDVQYFVLGGT